MSDSSTSRTAACQPPLSFTVTHTLLKFMSIGSLMLSNHLILCHTLLLLPSVSARSESFPMSQLFPSGGQIIRTLASVHSMHIRGWFPLWLTALISLQSKGLAGVFSRTTIRKHQFFGPQLVNVQFSHPSRITGKTIALSIWTCQQSDVSAFYYAF